eukprot:3447821-Rhodomonas_salina.1
MALSTTTSTIASDMGISHMPLPVSASSGIRFRNLGDRFEVATRSNSCGMNRGAGDDADMDGLLVPRVSNHSGFRKDSPSTSISSR